jgi:hypothetical protein
VTVIIIACLNHVTLGIVINAWCSAFHVHSTAQHSLAVDDTFINIDVMFYPINAIAGRWWLVEVTSFSH